MRGQKKSLGREINTFSQSSVMENPEEKYLDARVFGRPWPDRYQVGSRESDRGLGFWVLRPTCTSLHDIFSCLFWRIVKYEETAQ